MVNVIAEIGINHKGNIQNAKGENSINNTIMYDGTQQMTTLGKTSLNNLI